jgi:hypothetical protein
MQYARPCERHSLSRLAHTTSNQHGPSPSSASSLRRRGAPARTRRQGGAPCTGLPLPEGLCRAVPSRAPGNDRPHNCPPSLFTWGAQTSSSHGADLPRPAKASRGSPPGRGAAPRLLEPSSAVALADALSHGAALVATAAAGWSHVAHGRQHPTRKLPPAWAPHNVLAVTRPGGLGTIPGLCRSVDRHIPAR